MARRWVLTGQEGFEASLEYETNISVPSADELGPNEVLVEMHAASLNHRELFIPSPGSLAGPIKPPLVPACDGAGLVKVVGSSVREFKPGDRVVTHVAPNVVESKGDDGECTLADASGMLGLGVDGTLCSVGIFPEAALVHAPTSLDWLSASTLSCTWTTAWNVLFGVSGKEIAPGAWVLVQGTGGVSVATLQLAVAAGANVVATTSSEERAAKLKELGAKHVVNYRSNPNNWGEEARKATPNGRGFDIIADIGGNKTLSQSLAAVRVGGVVEIVGAVAEDTDPVPLFAAWVHSCIVRGFLASTRRQFKDLVRYIDEKGIKPAYDDTVFELADTKDAYRRLNEKKHFSKVVIRIDHTGA